MRRFDYSAPTTVQEALGILGDSGDTAKVMAGGTDLIPQMRTSIHRPDHVVDVKKIPELNVLEYDADDGLTLGSVVPCYRIYSEPIVAQTYPGLIDAASIIGGIQTQGRASIGGNLCNASPSADAIPALIALGASANVVSARGHRRVPVEAFCTGVRQSILEPEEMLESIRIPAPPPVSGARYIRFTPRNEMDIAVVGVGASVTLDDGMFSSVRVALGAVAPTPLLVREVGEALLGQPAIDRSVDLASKIARDAAVPITDMRGTAEFRTHLTGVLTRRALTAAIERANANT